MEDDAIAMLEESISEAAEIVGSFSAWSTLNQMIRTRQISTNMPGEYICMFVATYISANRDTNILVMTTFGRTIELLVEPTTGLASYGACILESGRENALPKQVLWVTRPDMDKIFAEIEYKMPSTRAMSIAVANSHAASMVTRLDTDANFGYHGLGS